MKVKVLESKANRLGFVIESTEPHIANALRRTLIADIPKMAIEDVEFHLGPIRGEDGKEYESIAPLFDEVIAHRLGMIPLPTDLQLFVRREECKSCNGEGCPSCTIIYSLNKKGPCMVMSGDLEPIGDTKLKPVDESIPIVKLGDGQAMLVYATAVLGTAREHAKWQVAAGVGYKYYPVVDIDNRKMNAAKAPVDVCPVNILKIRDKKVAVEGEEKCTLCMQCVEAFDPGSISVKGDPTRIIFHFETDGSMRADEALNAALDTLDKKLSDLAATVDSLGE